jgi:hypothetical protein
LIYQREKAEQSELESKKHLLLLTTSKEEYENIIDNAKEEYEDIIFEANKKVHLYKYIMYFMLFIILVWFLIGYFNVNISI